MLYNECTINNPQKCLCFENVYKWNVVRLLIFQTIMAEVSCTM